MLIKILGSGCAKCNRLEQLTREAVAELGLAADFEHIRDMEKILGISRSRVSWFIAELERRKWIEVTRCAIWFHDGTRSNKQNVYRVKL